MTPSQHPPPQLIGRKHGQPRDTRDGGPKLNPTWVEYPDVKFVGGSIALENLPTCEDAAASAGTGTGGASVAEETITPSEAHRGGLRRFGHSMRAAPARSPGVSDE